MIRYNSAWIVQCWASGCGGMADAQDSKSCGGDLVWVQVPPSALGNDHLNPDLGKKRIWNVWHDEVRTAVS